MTPKVIGPSTGSLPLDADREKHTTFCSEVFHEVFAKCQMYSLEESMHAPVVVRKVARDARVSDDSRAKVKVNIMTEVVPQAGDKARPVAKATTFTASTRFYEFPNKEVKQVCLDFCCLTLYLFSICALSCVLCVVLLWHLCRRSCALFS
jgi:hypothetical protein